MRRIMCERRSRQALRKPHPLSQGRVVAMRHDGDGDHDQGGGGLNKRFHPCSSDCVAVRAIVAMGSE